jgi:hypothetical protein
MMYSFSIFFPLGFWSFNEACICHDIQPRRSVKNSSIRGLMSLYHICPDGLPPYMPWRHLYKGTTCTSILTNKEIAPLIYLRLLCVLVYCSWGLGKGDMIHLRLLHVSSWDQEREHGSGNPWKAYSQQYILCLLSLLFHVRVWTMCAGRRQGPGEIDCVFSLLRPAAVDTLKRYSKPL